MSCRKSDNVTGTFRIATYQALKFRLRTWITPLTGPYITQTTNCQQPNEKVGNDNQDWLYGVYLPSRDAQTFRDLKTLFILPTETYIVYVRCANCSIIIFHLIKLWKAKFRILCDVIVLVRLQGNFKMVTLGSEKG